MRKNWTEAQVQTLTTLMNEGMTIPVIAQAVGREDTSVYNKMWHMGILKDYYRIQEMREQPAVVEEKQQAFVFTPPTPTKKHKLVIDQVYVQIRREKPSLFARFTAWLKGYEWRDLKEVIRKEEV